MTITLERPVIQDEDQRVQALDTTQSFIVQAPAGSGKTELLTQRFLILLSRVLAPEEILAITFTKKAAAEMRTRIIKTLQQAATQPEPETPHARKTWQLARLALEKSMQLNWDLLHNPGRLRIQTIDSFNASLVKRLPILSQFGAPPEITDDTKLLYREAIREFPSHLENASDWAQPIAQLLQHRDNDINKMEDLLVDMLENRDQWLPYLGNVHNPESLREYLQEQLQAVVDDIFAKLNKALPLQHQAELMQLLNFAGRYLEENDINSPLTYFSNLDKFPDTTIENLPLWLALKELLLTNELTFRRRFENKHGFPPQSSAKGSMKVVYAEMKKRMENLNQAFSQDEQLLSALSELHHAPAHFYTDEQWAILVALHHILLLAVAELFLVFRNHGKVDYIQNALAALAALGDEESPTDLALALDYQIKHILIDEFQDTSSSQFRLIKTLTAGWQTGDGRTLFIVGDPMQSIYRFREADVGLFIRARRAGLGNIKLIPLTLSVNFRSTPQIVEWVNNSFQKILPPFEDISTGAVSYNKSKANDAKHQSDSAVNIHCHAPHQQAQEIVTLIQQRRRDNPQGKIAILVRARPHLKFIIPALKQANLTYRAIKIDPLNSRSVIQDLMALTRALLNPADRVAWLALLRAPWCGLTLADLLALTTEQTVYQAISQAQVRQKLSADGQARLARVLPVLTDKLQERQRLSLAQWVKSTWLMLGGPACLEQDNELDDVGTYFSLLENLDRGGVLVDVDNLADAVKKLFAAPNSQADDSLQIMTIHNAKGLEFDTVILPYLEKRPPNPEKQLLLFMEKTREHSTNALVLAPLGAVGKEDDKIYNYVKSQHKIKNEHETGRLLYVAATRAKQYLHLFLSVDEERKVDSNSLLHKLMPAIGSEIETHLAATPAVALTPAAVLETPRLIQRLVSSWQNPLREIGIKKVTQQQTLSRLQMPSEIARLAGTVVHLILQQISRLGLAWWQQHSSAAQQVYLKNQLTQLGVLESELVNAIQHAQLAIITTLQDARGLWILQAQEEAQTEYAITVVIGGLPQQFKIDKTFVEGGKRWIIDYKTTLFSGNNLQDFLQGEQLKHTEQMQHYFQAMQAIEERPIHLGLYFPLIPAWQEWTFY
jgi:ATP-dependent helicase/nuclease subunit A